MLTYAATNDGEILDKLSMEIFGKPFEGKIGYVLYDDGNPAGVAKLTVTPEKAVLQFVGVVLKLRNKRYGDFFTRSLLNGASGVSEEIEIAYEDDYFLKFGFEKRNGIMRINSERLTFPCECGKGR